MFSQLLRPPTNLKYHTSNYRHFHQLVAIRHGIGMTCNVHRIHKHNGVYCCVTKHGLYSGSRIVDMAVCSAAVILKERTHVE